MSEDERWIVIPRWDEFQHYRDREPTWIKLYTRLADDPEWLALSLSERGLLVTVWTAYARSDGTLSTRHLHRYVTGPTRTRQLDRLNHAGWLEFSASKPLALARARGEKEKEKEPSKPPADAGGLRPVDNSKPRVSAKTLRKYTGCKWVRGSHSSAYVRDVLGTSKPPADWPYPKPEPDEIRAALEARPDDAA